MIALVDYGMANLRSVEKALLQVGGDPVITSDPQIIRQAQKVVLPGVGAFCAAMSNLHRSGLRDAVVASIETGKPFLGICLGLQMLFDTSTEMGDATGLGVLSGKVVRLFEQKTEDSRTQSQNPTAYCLLPAACPLKVPHIGWNALHFPRESRLLHGLEEGVRVYFVHSYYPDPTDASLISATSDYGAEFCCAIEKDNIAATQFHPEKSGAVGLQILRNFVVWK